MSTIAYDYSKELAYCLNKIGEQTATIKQVAQVIHIAHLHNYSIYIFGNGGSATTTLHFATDLGKLGIKAHTGIDNIGLLTAWANDEDYSIVFKKQIEYLGKRDVVMCFSVSGNSPNILAAAGYASTKQATVIGLTSSYSNCLAKLSKILIVTPSNSYGIVEDTHLVLCHVITEILKEKLCSNSKQ